MATKTVRVEVTGDPSSFERSMTVVSESASKATSKVEDHAIKVGGAFNKLDETLADFGIPFTGALSEIGAKIDEFQVKGTSNFQKLSKAGGIALAGLAVAAAGVGLESIHLADAFEQSHATLETAVKNTGGTFDEYSGKIDGANKKLEGLGFTNTETEGALARLVTGTKDVAKSVDLMGLAADIARARHMSLEQATDLLVKVESGRYTVLGRTLGVSKEVVAGLHSTDDAVKLLTDRFGGAAQQQADTFQGKLKTLEAQLTDIGIKIGTFLIPIVEDLTAAISDTIDWFEKHKAAAIAVATVITGVLGAAIAVFVYDKVASFVGGIQRMLTGLGLLEAKAVETAATVDAASAAGGAGAAAGGAEAAGGAAIGAEGAAAGGGLSALAGGAALAAASLALVVGVGAGLARTFGIVNDETIKVDFNMGNLATESVPKLTANIARLADGGRVMDRVLQDHNASVLGTKTLHDSFNQVLDQSPQFADKFIAGVQGAGLSTDWFSRKLREHQAAAEEAKVSQERMALQMEIVDAKARGDAGAVYGLTLQLNALPTNKQIEVAVYGNALSVLGDIHAQLGNLPAEVRTQVVIDVKKTLSGL